MSKRMYLITFTFKNITIYCFITHMIHEQNDSQVDTPCLKLICSTSLETEVRGHWILSESLGLTWKIDNLKLSNRPPIYKHLVIKCLCSYNAESDCLCLNLPTEGSLICVLSAFPRWLASAWHSCSLSEGLWSPFYAFFFLPSRPFPPSVMLHWSWGYLSRWGAVRLKVGEHKMIARWHAAWHMKLT